MTSFLTTHPVTLMAGNGARREKSRFWLPMIRDHRVTVRLSSQELAKLDRLRCGSRASFMRQLLRSADPSPALVDVADRDEVLALLSEHARDGSVPATLALLHASSG